MANELVEQMKAMIREGSELTGWSESTVCLRAVNNGRLYQRLQEGGNFNVSTYERLKKWLAHEKNKRVADG